VIYEEVAREFPGRVLAAIIRQVGADNDDRNSSLLERAESLRREGIPMHLVADAAQGAELANRLRLCGEDTVLEVRAELDG
jgi:phosphatidate phosphatase APP1